MLNCKGAVVQFLQPIMMCDDTTLACALSNSTPGAFAAITGCLGLYKLPCLWPEHQAVTAGYLSEEAGAQHAECCKTPTPVTSRQTVTKTLLVTTDPLDSDNVPHTFSAIALFGVPHANRTMWTHAMWCFLESRFLVQEYNKRVNCPFKASTTVIVVNMFAVYCHSVPYGIYSSIAPPPGAH